MEIQTFSFKSMHLKMSLAEWQPFCFGLNVLIFTVFQEYLQYNLAYSHLSQFIVSGLVQTKLDGKYQSGEALPWVQTIIWCLIVNSTSPWIKLANILADHIFKWIFLNENYRILVPISLKFVPRSVIDTMAALVQVMAWHRTGNKPLP